MRVRLGFVGKLVVEKIGRSGGLCLFWSSNVTVVLKGYSRNHIDVMVCSHGDLWWLYTGFYGQPEAHLRSQFWCLLERLADGYSGPWVMKELVSRGVISIRMAHSCKNVWIAWCALVAGIQCFQILMRCPKQKGRFHFEMAWANDPGCREIIAITGEDKRGYPQEEGVRGA
ncbi:hypothetical protein G4B88_023686 [Cannabis sativa]|uniref:Uncharacterized protein n=1 Tax=Cannabis sativa TaxID=3483 RepID=A0A7J6HV38_CANSA|nr:hypothetical protein G4B88_023686 [Cannabis sativa]